MKLILTQEVSGLGSPGDVVEVKDGYGRNYLIPRDLGVRWTRGGEKTVETIKAARASRAVRDHDHAEEVRTKLEAETVNVQVRAGEGGRLFGSVSVTEIADATRRLLDDLVTSAPPKNREEQAEKRRARSAERYEAIRRYQEEKRTARAG